MALADLAWSRGISGGQARWCLRPAPGARARAERRGGVRDRRRRERASSCVSRSAARRGCARPSRGWLLGPAGAFYSRARRRGIGYTIACPPGHRSGDGTFALKAMVTADGVATGWSSADVGRGASNSAQSTLVTLTRPGRAPRSGCRRGARNPPPVLRLVSRPEHPAVDWPGRRWYLGHDGRRVLLVRVVEDPGQELGSFAWRAPGPFLCRNVRHCARVRCCSMRGNTSRSCAPGDGAEQPIGARPIPPACRRRAAWRRRPRGSAGSAGALPSSRRPRSGRRDRRVLPGRTGHRSSSSAASWLPSWARTASQPAPWAARLRAPSG